MHKTTVDIAAAVTGRLPTVILFISLVLAMNIPVAHGGDRSRTGIDIEKTAGRIRDHLKTLTVDIGERSVRTPESHARAAAYIESFYRSLGMETARQPYPFGGKEVANITADIRFGGKTAKRYILGAHYDSLAGTVGADDNASAVAVQLEVARELAGSGQDVPPGLAVRFVSFALEEPPAYETPQMGSRVYTRNARRTGEKIDGMLCLEMVGYTCSEPGCQQYPFPLMFMGYPETGNFIGIVGNLRSRRLTRSLAASFGKNPALPVVDVTIPLAGWLVPAVRLSDHAPFWDEGYRAVMITDTAFFRNPHYHLLSDTMDRLDFGFMAQLVESIVHFFQSGTWTAF